eukprot:1157179-Pelagomonas_calceolata.AAC.11
MAEHLGCCCYGRVYSGLCFILNHAPFCESTAEYHPRSGRSIWQWRAKAPCKANTHIQTRMRPLGPTPSPRIFTHIHTHTPVPGLNERLALELEWRIDAPPSPRLKLVPFVRGEKLPCPPFMLASPLTLPPSLKLMPLPLTAMLPNLQSRPGLHDILLVKKHSVYEVHASILHQVQCEFKYRNGQYSVPARLGRPGAQLGCLSLLGCAGCALGAVHNALHDHKQLLYHFPLDQDLHLPPSECTHGQGIYAKSSDTV